MNHFTRKITAFTPWQNCHWKSKRPRASSFGILVLQILLNPGRRTPSTPKLPDSSVGSAHFRMSLSCCHWLGCSFAVSCGTVPSSQAFRSFSPVKLRLLLRLSEAVIVVSHQCRQTATGTNSLAQGSLSQRARSTSSFFFLFICGFKSIKVKPRPISESSCGLLVLLLMWVPQGMAPNQVNTAYRNITVLASCQPMSANSASAQPCIQAAWYANHEPDEARRMPGGWADHVSLTSADAYAHQPSLWFHIPDAHWLFGFLWFTCGAGWFALICHICPWFSHVFPYRFVEKKNIGPPPQAVERWRPCPSARLSPRNSLDLGRSCPHRSRQNRVPQKLKDGSWKVLDLLALGITWVFHLVHAVFIILRSLLSIR